MRPDQATLVAGNGILRRVPAGAHGPGFELQRAGRDNDQGPHRKGQGFQYFPEDDRKPHNGINAGISGKFLP